MHHRSHDQHPWGVSASRASVYGGVVCIQWGLHPGGHPPPRDTWDTTGYGQQEAGTYPTGMALT